MQQNPDTKSLPRWKTLSLNVNFIKLKAFRLDKRTWIEDMVDIERSLATAKFKKGPHSYLYNSKYILLLTLKSSNVF